MALRESGEDYLESILVLREKNGMVRSVDIAQHLGYSKPSVSRAMALLRGSGHILMEDTGHITLTSLGEVVAKDIYKRHRLLTGFLMRLGVPEEVASEDACHIEHYISEITFECLSKFVDGCDKINTSTTEGEEKWH